MSIFMLMPTIIVLYVCCITADQHQYQTIIENVTMEYLDRKFLDMTVTVFKFNHASAINSTIIPKCDLPDDAKTTVQAFKIIGSDYRVPIFIASRKLKDALEMEMFDLHRVFVEIIRPPMTSPLRKGIAYRLDGWVPDSTKYPPNLPEGKWKAIATLELANKTKMSVIHVYGRFDYYK